MGRAYGHGWLSLPSEGEVYVEHGVPRQVRIEGNRLGDVERIADEVGDVAGVRVTLGRWETDEETGEMEAVVHVAAEDVSEILKRLAHASAETFYDRYRKRMEAGDIDFDDEAFAQDMSFALDACNLHWSQIDARPLKRVYVEELHRDVDEMAEQFGHQASDEKE